MDDWKTIWAELDDDYLIGLANKGIVKRAYKDKEEGDYKILSVSEKPRVRVGKEEVSIRLPLGESTCSCPSRTICRHVILGILALKEQAEQAAGTAQKTREAEEAGKNDPEKINPPENPEILRGQIASEIAMYPVKDIFRALTVKQLQAVIVRAKTGQKPEIGHSSVINVSLPEMGQKVTLLSPLEYSTCSCHKKGFCAHKAAAVLWCKLESGQMALSDLEKEVVELPAYDMEQVGEAAGQMKMLLEELLDTGLARTSPDVLDSLERLAVISHNARLARFEGYWRGLHNSYGNYLKRKASFRVQDLMGQMAKLYRRAGRLEAAENVLAVSRLAGEFRAEYMPVGNLDLVGIAVEHFDNRAGYEGETVYFLEERTKEWYTYTTARPVFYEKSGKWRKGAKEMAPWGIPCALKELAQSRIHLDGAKCDGKKRLSSSQETKGELIGTRKKGNALTIEELGGWYYRSFGQLFEERMEKEIPWLKEEETEEEGKEGTVLVFLHPASCEKAFFSETEQKLFMKLYDEAAREVVIEVAYSQREAWGIRYLERIEGGKPPCFLGKIYWRDGRIRMYPVAVMEEWELVEEGRPDEKKEQAEAYKAGSRIIHGPAGGKAVPGEKEEALEALLEETGNLLEDLYQSGLDTVHDSTLEGLRDMAGLTRQYGMAWLSELLGKLAEGLAMRRHRMEHRADELAQCYTDLNEYLYLCGGKITYDRGRGYYIEDLIREEWR